MIIPAVPQRQVVRPPAPRGGRGRGGRRGRPRLDPDTDMGKELMRIPQIDVTLGNQ